MRPHPLLFPLGALALALAAPVAAQPRNVSGDRIVGNLRITDGQVGQQVRLQVSKSIIIELPQDARDIVVSNPQVANAVVRSARRVFVIGTGIGSTNLFFFDDSGQRIAAVDLVIERDLEGLSRTLRRLFPTNDIRVEGIGENVVLSGQVNNASDARMAVDVAERFVNQQPASTALGAAAPGQPAPGGAPTLSGATAGAGSGSASSSRVVNALTIAGRDQVQLRVVVAEMNRRAMQQIGVNLQGNFGLGGNGIRFNQTNPYPVNAIAGGTLPAGQPPYSVATGSSGLIGSGFITGQLAAQVDVRAFEQTGLVRTLAEPTLTAISGESASFLAGGEFPVPVGRDRDGNITIEFKQFGVALSFVPVVLSENRISVRLRTEVSEIDPSAGYTGAGGFVIPGLSVRRADSTLELPSGGTLVLAGLIRDQTRRAVAGTPLLRRLPVLGRLFSSQDFLQDQTELVVLVTPVVVQPVARRDLALPTDGFVNASDPEALLFNRINSVYGTRNAPPPAGRPNGRFGYIYE